MKTKEVLDPKFINNEKPVVAPKPKSLRPMRSLVAVRSLKPRTTVAQMAQKEVIEERT